MEDDRQRTMRTLRRLLILAATAFVLAVLGLDVLTVVGWPEGGPIALAQVLAAHLTIVTLIVVPVAFLHEARVLRAGLVALVVLSLVRFGGEWWSLPAGAPDGAARLDVATLNLEVGSGTPAAAVSFLRSTDARMIALQELTPAVSAAITADAVLADRYPYQALYPRADVLGLGLLSADPLGEVRFDLQPSRLVATVATPVGSVRVVDVHPLHGSVARGPFGLPLGYETDDRAAALDVIRATVAGDERGSPVLLLGDINTAPTEPAFGNSVEPVRHRPVGIVAVPRCARRGRPRPGLDLPARCRRAARDRPHPDRRRLHRSRAPAGRGDDQLPGDGATTVRSSLRSSRIRSGQNTSGTNVWSASGGRT